MYRNDSGEMYVLLRNFYAGAGIALTSAKMRCYGKLES